MKIDLINWKEIKILSLFELFLSAGDNQENKLFDGDIPLISSGKYNNGVCKFIDKGDGISEKYQGNQITVDMFGQAFYQPNDFYAVSHGRINILRPLFELNENIGLFLATVMTKKFSEKYAMVDMCSQSALSEETIKLPCKNDKVDWKYMDSFIETVKSSSSKQFDFFVKMKQLNDNALNMTKWKKFKVGDIFPNIIKPVVYHSHEVIEEENGIPYVVRSKFDNGVKFRVKKPTKINPANVISFGAENSNFFYQKEEWCSGRDIYYIDVHNLTENQSLFIASCFQTLCYRYNYAYGLFPDLLKEEFIKLPVDDNNDIDYDFMEKFMNNAKNNCKKKMATINRLFE